jgi:hypothetical protein
MVGRTVDNLLQGMTRDHIRIMDLENKLSKWWKIVKGESHTKMLQKLTKTNSPRYSHLCRGKRKMKRWYGTDCA